MGGRLALHLCQCGAQVSAQAPCLFQTPIVTRHIHNHTCMYTIQVLSGSIEIPLLDRLVPRPTALFRKKQTTTSNTHTDTASTCLVTVLCNNHPISLVTIPQIGISPHEEIGRPWKTLLLWPMAVRVALRPPPNKTPSRRVR